MFWGKRKAEFGGKNMPLSTFDGTVKFHRPANANPFDLLALNYCFPSFLESSSPTEAQLEGMDRVKTASADFAIWQSRLERRFAGDDTLTRGSYYALCRAEDGDDHGTLTSELNAYRKCIPEQYIVALSYPDLEPVYQKTFSNEGHHAVYIYIQNFAPLVELAAANNVRLPPQIYGSSDRGGVIAIPCTVEPIHVPDVLDLRLIEPRNWLFNTFRTGDGTYFEKPFGKSCTSFYQMLPELMNPVLGGSDFVTGGSTQGIGLALRVWGVGGFIYPSARNDAFVEYDNSKFLYSGGFNLVDYRQSDRTPKRAKYHSMSGWEEPWPVQNTLVAPKGKHFGSYRCRGIREGAMRSYEREVKRMHPTYDSPMSYLMKGFES